MAQQVIQECGTHEARRQEDGIVNIYEKSLHLPKDPNDIYDVEMFFPEVLIFKNATQEDVFNIFEDIEENNRINLAQANADMQNL